MLDTETKHGKLRVLHWNAISCITACITQFTLYYESGRQLKAVLRSYLQYKAMSSP